MASALRMKLKERIHKRFAQLGLRYVRAPREEAEALAAAISDSHDRLGAFCSYCLAPTACPPDVGFAIVVRWLETVPVMLPVASILNRKPVTPGEFRQLDPEGLEALFSSAMSLADRSRAITSNESSPFANCVVRCASPALSFYQRCMAPEDHTLEVLARSLAAYAGAFPHAAAAHQLLQPSVAEDRLRPNRA